MVEEKRFKLQVELSNGNVINQSGPEALTEDEALKAVSDIMETIREVQKTPGVAPYVHSEAFQGRWLHLDHIAGIYMVE